MFFIKQIYKDVLRIVSPNTLIYSKYFDLGKVNVKTVIKVLIHSSAVHLSRYEAFEKFGMNSKSYTIVLGCASGNSFYACFVPFQLPVCSVSDR